MCTAAAPILVVPLQALSLFFSSTIIPSPDARHTKERKKERLEQQSSLPQQHQQTKNQF
jgi:hypothetical protein